MSDKPLAGSKYDHIDPLKESYREKIVHSPERVESLREERTALLCIDMQYLDAARGYGVFTEEALRGVPPQTYESYFTALETSVLPNVRRLQETFRKRGLEVIHIRICSLTRNGRDRSPGHRRLDLHAAPGSKESEILPEVAPVGDEIVIDKTASGVFNATNLHYVLRNLEIDSLFVTGVYTDECVSTTVRDAADLGFHVTLIEDGCATVTPDRHNFTIATLRDRYTRVMTTDQAIDQIRQHVPAG